MTTTLPSFVELMASLGLESTADSSDSQSSNRHSRSSSHSSTSSIISQSSSDASQSLANRVTYHSPLIVVSGSPGKDIELDRRRYRVRYSPYTPAISHIRRGSLPSNVKEEEVEERLDGTGSSSPRQWSPLRTMPRRSSVVGLTNGPKRPQKLCLDSDLIANTPISTFLRRKTPQTSPISPTFPHRKRSSSPALPVSIPTLPTFIFPQLGTSVVNSDTDDEMMSDDSSSNLNTAFRRRKAAHRPRSTSRFSEPDGTNPRRNRHRRRISPLA